MFVTVEIMHIDVLEDLVHTKPQRYRDILLIIITNYFMLYEEVYNTTVF